MINPAKIFKMQQEAKSMQKKMREQKVSGESRNGRVKIFMNMAQEFEDIHIDNELLSPDSLGEIRKGLEEAFKDYQKKLQKEMVKDFDLDQLKRMLG